jgi:phosphonoacetate hydrolase
LAVLIFSGPVALADEELRFAVTDVDGLEMLHRGLVKHHRGFGGVSYVYTRHPREIERVRETLLSLEGVEEVLDREEASTRFRLMASRIGDLVVLPDRHTVFGEIPEEVEILAPTYRSHGSLYEMDIPLVLHHPERDSLNTEKIQVNLDLTRLFFP